MHFLKKISLSLLFVLPILGFSLPKNSSDRRGACGKKNEEASRYLEGFVVGFQGNTTVMDYEYLMTLGYYVPYMLVDVGFNFEHFDRKNRSNVSTGTIVGHIGGRSKIGCDYFVSYGGHGGGEIKNRGKPVYSVGLFAGLEKSFNTHFMIAGKIYPFTFQHSYYSTKRYQVFEGGSISVFYSF